jgi:ABC-type dipeptide/oligopeptide/nickel transport system permease subunit
MSGGPPELLAVTDAPAAEGDLDGADAGAAAASLRRLFLRRLLADRVAVGSAAFIVALALIAIFAPLIVKAVGARGPDVVDPSARDRFGNPLGPSPDALWPFIAVLAGAALASGSRFVPIPIVRRYAWAVISGLAFVAAILLGIVYWPGAHHIFGVDREFRDLFSRVLYGARLSLEVSVIAAAVSSIIGVMLGILAGYLRGWIGIAISRSIDALFALPMLILGVGIAASCKLGKGCLGGVLHPGMAVVIVVIALAQSIYVARVMRDQVLSLCDEGFVEAARSQGSSPGRIIGRELLPNLLAPIAGYAALLIAQGVLFMAALSYLGIGVQLPQASWGAMLGDANTALDTAWWYMLFPGAALLLTLLAFNVFGDGLRDALKPRTGGT